MVSGSGGGGGGGGARTGNAAVATTSDGVLGRLPLGARALRPDGGGVSNDGGGITGTMGRGAMAASNRESMLAGALRAMDADSPAGVTRPAVPDGVEALLAPLGRGGASPAGDP